MRNEFEFDGLPRELRLSEPRLSVSLIEVQFKGLVDIEDLTGWLKAL